MTFAEAVDAAYCRAKHHGEHLGRPEGCGSWTAQLMAADPEFRAAMTQPTAERIEGLRDHSMRQGTWGIEYGDDQFYADVMAALTDR